MQSGVPPAEAEQEVRKEDGAHRVVSQVENCRGLCRKRQHSLSGGRGEGVTGKDQHRPLVAAGSGMVWHKFAPDCQRIGSNTVRVGTASITLP